MGRHDAFLPIGHTWKGLKKAVRRKSRGVFRVDEYTYRLPEKFFGQETSDGQHWLPVKAYALDLQNVLAKALLDVDPKLFATRPKTHWPQGATESFLFCVCLFYLPHTSHIKAISSQASFVCV
jgi:hypothetical protein